MAPDAVANNNEKGSVSSFEVKVKRSSSDGSSVFQEEEVYECGWGKFTPSWLQCCNNAKGFLAAYCMFVIIQGSLVNGFVNVSISTLERRFGLTSSETGVISTGYDIAFCILTMFVTYFGSRSHRPRWVGIGCFIMGVGALIFCLPHFTTPNYEYAEDFSADCTAHNGTNCEEAPSSLHNYVYVFILGQLLHGVGCTPLYTLGLSFIEDSVPKESASVYLGIGNAASIFGPVLGYGLGGLVLSVWVDFDTVDESLIEIDPSDPRWVGAWWLGIISAMACAFALTIPILGFPRDFPGASEFRAKRVSEVYNDGSEDITEREGFGRSYKDFPIALWTLLKNPTYILTSLAGCSEAMVISGFTTFLPKIIENLYQLPAGDAAIMAGIISIPGGIVGHVLAGIIVKKFNLKTANILKMSAFCCILVCAGAPVLFLYCSNQPVAGITHPYLGGSSPSGDLTASCNANCTCQGEYYIPVCGADNVIYFTACHAGCTTSSEINGTTFYKDCSCIMNTTSEGWQAERGLCPSNCNTLATFLGIFFVVVMFTFMSSTPALVVTFRVVPPTMRSFAIGVQWLLIRALGSIPGPILFGFIIDFTCILWQIRECDGKQGACWIYNSYDMAVNVLIISCVCKLVSASFFSGACFLYKPPPDPEIVSETELKEQTSIVNEAFKDDITTPEKNGGDIVGHASDDGDNSSVNSVGQPVTVL